MEHGRWKHAVARRLMRSGVGFWRGVFIIETSVRAGGRSWKVFSLSSRKREREWGWKGEDERKIERKSERKVASQALITSGGLLKLECLRLSSPCVTIIISITWYYSRHFTTLARMRVRRRMHFARAQVHTSKYVSAPLLSPKLLKTSRFLIVSAQCTSLCRTFFSLSFSSGYLRKTLEKLPAARDAGKGIFAVSGIFAGEAKISLPSTSVCLVNLISSYNN